MTTTWVGGNGNPALNELTQPCRCQECELCWTGTFFVSEHEFHSVTTTWAGGNGNPALDELTQPCRCQ